MKVKQIELLDAIRSNGTLEEISNMIEGGADVNDLGNGELPLNAAIQQGNYELTEFLIKNGADVNSTLGNQTALLSSIWSPNDRIFELLLSYKADIHMVSDNHINLLSAAIIICFGHLYYVLSNLFCCNLSNTSFVSTVI